MYSVRCTIIMQMCMMMSMYDYVKIMWLLMYVDDDEDEALVEGGELLY